MRSETDGPQSRSQRPLGGAACPPQWALLRMAAKRWIASIRSTLRKGCNASNTGRGWDLCFSWVADLSSRLVVMATTSRYFLRHLAHVPFGEGTMRRTGSGDRSFWRFINGTHNTTNCLKRVVPLVTPSVFDVRPLVSGGTPRRPVLAGDRTGNAVTTFSDGSPTPHRRTPGGR